MGRKGRKEKNSTRQEDQGGKGKIRARRPNVVPEGKTHVVYPETAM